MSGSSTRGPGPSTWLSAAFFASGAAALVFETLWFRQAGQMLGNGIWASSVVLASFMGGLALGNTIVGRWGPRWRRPISVYAGLEVAIGALGLGLVCLFPRLIPLAAGWLGPTVDHPLLLNGLRLGLAFGLLLLPTTAMGATLPLVVKGLSGDPERFGPVLGRLYGWNTLGAVLGAFGGETLLIPLFGLLGAGALAASLNLLAALAARAVAGACEPVRVAAAPAPALRPGAGAALRLLAAAALAGATLLALEVVWFRFLLLFNRGTSLAFAAMLSVVLLGIGLGGHGAALWLRRRRADEHLCTVALAAGAAVTLTYWGFGWSLRLVGSTYWETPREILVAAAALMLPTCLASGLLFTLQGQALRRRNPDDASAAAQLTLANTLGALAGALAGSVVLLPWLGMERSLFVLAASYGLVAALLAPLARPSRPARWLAAGSAVLSIGLLAAFPFGRGERYLRLVAERWLPGGAEVLERREGLLETVQLLEQRFLGAPVEHRLLTNGFTMSGTRMSAQRYMRTFVYLPLALEPEARSALLICYGVGETAKALTDSAGLERIDVVDLSRDILAVGRRLFPPGQHPLDDPRVQVFVEDGRFHLLTRSKRYDLITGEPPPPKCAGTVNLYSREYFELMRDRLNQGGLATYWLPVRELSWLDARAIVAGFCSAFPDCSLWSGAGTEWILLGSRQARRRATPETFTRQWRDPVVGAQLRELALEGPDDLAAMFLADSADLQRFSGSARPLEDGFPGRLSTSPATPADRRAFLDLLEPGGARERFRRSRVVRELWPAGLPEPEPEAFDTRAMLDLCLWSPQSLTLEGLRDRLLRSRRRAAVLWLLGSTERHQRLAARAATNGASAPLVAEHQAVGALADRSFERAAELFGSAAERAEPGNRELLRIKQAFALGLAGRRAEAASLVREFAPQASPAGASGWRWLAREYGPSEPDTERERSAPR